MLHDQITTKLSYIFLIPCTRACQKLSGINLKHKYLVIFFKTLTRIVTAKHIVVSQRNKATAHPFKRKSMNNKKTGSPHLRVNLTPIGIFPF